MVAKSFGAQRVFTMRSGTAVGLATARLYEGFSSIILRASARALLARIGSEAHGDAADAQLRAHVSVFATSPIPMYYRGVFCSSCAAAAQLLQKTPR